MNTARVIGRKTLSGLLGAAMALVAQMTSAGTITGSAHDFSAITGTSGQICIACHAPHNTNTTVAFAPLWNHALSAATYTVYSTPTLNAGVLAQPGGVSKLCLSCHDGTVAVNSFGGTTGTVALANASSNLGTSLANDHPIGFTYDAALATADGALFAPTKAVTIGSGAKTKTGTITSTMLNGTQMECSSCHDVHNTFTVGTTKLVKVTMAGSALCLTCHDK